MIFLRLLLLILFLPFLLLGRLLGFGRADLAYLPEGHPEMAEAFAQAKASLPDFRRLLSTPGPGMDHFAIKARIPVEGGTEHIWVDHLETLGNGFRGTLANDPQGMPNLARGSVVDVAEDQISDWGYAANGVYQGHFTTKIIMKHSSKRMQKQIAEAYGWSDTGAAGH